MGFLALLLLVLLLGAAQAWLYRARALDGLEYSLILSRDEAVEGDKIEIIETVVNNKWLPLPWLKAELTTSKWLDFAGARARLAGETRYVPSFFALGGYRKITRRWQVACAKRGEFALDTVILVTSDLFGLVSCSLPVKVAQHITVLPAPIDFDFPAPAPYALMGDTRVRRHIAEDPFFRAGTREYTERDPMSKIAWTATARQGSLMVFSNEFTTRGSLEVILNLQSTELDKTDVMRKPEMELAIKVCATLFEQADLGGMPAGFSCNADVTVPLSWGAEHTADLLRALAALPLASTVDFPILLRERFAEAARGGGATDIAVVAVSLTESLADALADAPDPARMRLYVLDPLTPDAPDVECEVCCLYEQLVLYRQAGRKGADDAKAAV